MLIGVKPRDAPRAETARKNMPCNKRVYSGRRDVPDQMRRLAIIRLYIKIHYGVYYSSL